MDSSRLSTTTPEHEVTRLKRRLAELEPLYAIATLTDQKGATFDDLMQELVLLVPRTVLDPLPVTVRLTIQDRIYTSPGFHPVSAHLVREISANCTPIGQLELHFPRLPGLLPRQREHLETLLDVITRRISRIYTRKRAEQDLSESEQRYRTLFETSRDAIYTADVPGSIIDANQAMCELFGYTRQEFIGRNAAIVYDDPAQRERFLASLHDAGEVRDYDVRFIQRCGTLMDCLITANLQHDRHGNVVGYQGIIRDITAARQAARERERLIAELQAALDKIRTLKGLVPICARCKKIRDDGGYWQQLEAYIEKHSDAVFSHGLCPHCQQAFEEEE